MRFDTTIDGPGRHGEAITIDSNDPASHHRPPLGHDLTFMIEATPPDATANRVRKNALLRS